MDKENWVKIEQLFCDISRDWFIDKKLSYESQKRTGVFSDALTIWLMILQRLSGLPLQGAVAELASEKESGIFAQLNRRSKKLVQKTISTNSGGFSRAKDRIDTETVQDLVKHCEAKLRRKLPKNDRIYLLDGTTLTTAYSKKTEKKYPRLRLGEDKKMYYPRMRLITAHNLANGIAAKPIYGTMYEGEQSLAWKYLAELPKKSTVIGDRNFGVFSVVYRAKKLGLNSLMRLNDHVIKRLVGGSIPSEDFDISTQWQASSTDVRTTAEIPKGSKVEGRLLKVTTKKKGYRDQAFYFFTTLSLPATEVAELHMQRQRVETHIAQLKQILKLEFVNSKTPERIEKEIYIAFLAFNLVTAIMAAAAVHNNIPFARISFTAAIRLIKIYSSNISIATDPRKRAEVIDRAFVAFYQTKLPLRKSPRSYPRVVKKRGGKFPSQCIVNVIPS